MFAEELEYVEGDSFEKVWTLCGASLGEIAAAYKSGCGNAELPPLLGALQPDLAADSQRQSGTIYERL